MKTIKYKNFLNIQNDISIDNMIQIQYDYGELKTTISYTLLKYVASIEEFICMVWKKDFFEDDKFDYALEEKERGVIKAEDLPKNDDFLIDVKSTSIEQAFKRYLQKSDYEKLNINFATINDCYLLSSDKHYSFDNYLNIPYGLNFIFKDEKRVYVFENCIDC